MLAGLSFEADSSSLRWPTLWITLANIVIALTTCITGIHCTGIAQPSNSHRAGPNKTGWGRFINIDQIHVSNQGGSG